MAIQSNFPAIKPSLLLDFASVKQLDPRITFTRATTATFYDGVTTAMAEQNLFTYSEQFDNAAWTKTNATVTANSTTAPDGTTTADTLFETTTNGQHRVFISAGVTGTYTISAYAKAAGRDYVALWFGGVDKGKFFYIPAGGAGSVGGNFVNAPDSASITYVGNDWYRCSVTVSGLSGSAQHINACLDATTYSYAGDVTKGVHIWGAQLEQRSAVTAYTATTTQAITNYIPVLQTAASGVARFDNNPTTGESLGLLIEEQRTNLVTYSSQFDNVAWTLGGSTITANTIIAPDGTLTSEKLIANASVGVSPSVYQAITVSTSTAYTWSVYAKAGEYSYLMIKAQDTTSGTNPTWFNLANGTIGTNSSGNTSTITSVGNGWYKCTVTRTPSATTGYINIQCANADNTSTLTGNGYSGIFIWGAQLEAGAFATSYIPTVASTVTRNADSASMTGTNFSSWYNFIEGALYTEASTVSSTSTSGNPIAMSSIEDGTVNNRLQNRFGGLVYSPRFVANGSSLLATTGVTTPINTFNKAIITYKSVNASSTYSSISAGNGAIIQSTSSAFSPASVNALLIGNGNTSAPLNGTVKKVAYYPIAVTSAQLQALTS